MARHGSIVAAWVVALFTGVAPATALTAGDTVVSGTFDDSDVTVTFSCTGTPTCNGAYTAVERFFECTNGPFVHGGLFVLTGLNLSQPGAFSGTILIENGQANTHVVNGVCKKLELGIERF